MQLEGTPAYIEFQDGRPFQILTMQTIQGIHGPYIRFEDYDIEWSKRYDVYCVDYAGSGPASLLTPRNCTFWADPATLVEPLGTCIRLETMPDLDFLKDAWECDAIYCSICDDMFPEEPLCQCKHIAWCDTCGWWSTPDKVCPHRNEDNSEYVEPGEEDEEE